MLCNFNYRLGLVDQAELHISQASPDCHGDLNDKIKKVKGHMVNGEISRLGENWMAALNEIHAIIAEGADSSRPVINCYSRICIVYRAVFRSFI